MLVHLGPSNQTQYQKHECDRILLRCFALLCGSLISVGMAAQQRASLYSDAQELLLAGNFTEGCPKARRVTQEDPRNFGAFNLLGVCSAQRGDGLSAENYFRKSLEINPRYSDARVNLALQLRQRGRKQAAVAQLKEVLSLEPKNVPALYQLGKTEIAAGSYERAVTYLLQARELSPETIAFIVPLADAYEELGRNDDVVKLLEGVLSRELTTDDLLHAALLAVAVKQEELAQRALKQIVQQDPNSFERILSTARYLSEKDDHKNARGFLLTVREKGDNSAEWNGLLGFSEYKLKDPEDSLNHLRKAIELSPRTPDYYLQMGQLLLYYNSDQAAAAFFKTGLQNLPDSAELHFGLAACYWAHQTDEPASIAELNKALEIRPDLQPALELLSVIYRYEKEWALLENTADRLIQANPRSGTGYYFKAYALLATEPDDGRRSAAFKKAYDLLQQSIRLDPHFSYSRIALGKVLAEHGDLPSAILQLRKAIDIAPNDSQGYYVLATTYRKAGEIAKSTESLKKFKEVKAREKETDPQEGLFKIVE
jgi:tetratricopeptide (TPR) repeat protein